MRNLRGNAVNSENGGAQKDETVIEDAEMKDVVVENADGAGANNGRTKKQSGETMQAEEHVKPNEEDEEEEMEEFYVNVVFPSNTTSFDATADPMKLQIASNGQRGQQNELQESIDYKNEAGASTSVNTLRVSGLDKEKPLFQNKSSILQGEWSNLVGSELVFDENGEFFGKVDAHIALQHGRLTTDKVDRRTLLERAKALALSVSGESAETAPENGKENPVEDTTV